MTPAERMRQMTANRRALGLVEVKCWVHPEQRERLKTFAAKLVKPKR